MKNVKHTQHADTFIMIKNSICCRNPDLVRNVPLLLFQHLEYYFKGTPYTFLIRLHLGSKYRQSEHKTGWDPNPTASPAPQGANSQGMVASNGT